MKRRLLMTVAAFGFGFLASAGTQALAQDKPPLCTTDCLLTGGEKGDYYRFFAPPVMDLLDKGWAQVPKAESPGTPASMDWVLTHQKSYFLAQGNVYADLVTNDPKYTGKFKLLSANKGLGNEVLLAIINDGTMRRSQGSWKAIAVHAKQVRIVTSSKESGPGRTLLWMMQKDPEHLGKGSPVYMDSVDAAIEAVATGKADVALMVQFPNPENPRFKMIAEKKLNIIGIIDESFRSLEIPGGGPAFTICEDAAVGPNVTVTTVCTPVLVATGATNDNQDVAKDFAKVTAADFMPKDTGFAKFWKAVKVRGGDAWEGTLKKANTLADFAASKM